MVLDRYLQLKNQDSAKEEEKALQELDAIGEMPEPEEVMGTDAEVIDAMATPREMNLESPEPLPNMSVEREEMPQPVITDAPTDAALPSDEEMNAMAGAEAKTEVTPSTESPEEAKALSELNEINAMPSGEEMNKLAQQEANDVASQESVQAIKDKPMTNDVVDDLLNQAKEKIDPMVGTSGGNPEISRVRQLLEKISKSRDQENKEIDDSAKNKRTAQMIIGMLKGAQQIYTANMGGNAHVLKADTSTLDKLSKMAEDNHKDNVRRIRSKTKNTAEGLKDIALESKLNQLDPTSKIASQARLLFASEMGKEKMADLEKMGVDLESMNYQQIFELQDRLIKSDLAESAVINKQIIKANKDKLSKDKEDRRLDLRDEDKITQMHQNTHGHKRAPLIKNLKERTFKAIELEDYLEPFLKGEKKMNEAEVINLSGLWSKFMINAAPSETMVFKSMPDNYKKDIAKWKNYLSPDEVDMSTYSPKILEHMGSQLERMKKLQFKLRNKEYANSLNAYRSLLKRNPEERDAVVKALENEVVWDTKEQIFKPAEDKNRMEKYFNSVKGGVDSEGNSVPQEVKVKLKNGKIAIFDKNKNFLRYD